MIIVFEHTYSLLARSHGLVAKADGSWPRGLGLKPGTVYWMDVSYYIKVKLKIKVAKRGTPKIILKKKILIHRQIVLKLL